MKGRRAKKLRQMASNVITYTPFFKIPIRRNNASQQLTSPQRHLYQILKGRRAPIVLSPTIKLGAAHG